jgi:photosystem II stability/assembly factor-like uncharacterized protein
MEDDMDIKKLLKKLPGAWVLAIIVVVWAIFFGIAKFVGHARTLRPIAVYATVILAIVWIIVIVLSLLKSKKEQDSKRMADATSAGSARIKNLEEKLLFAIKALRQSKVGKTVGKADAQFAVPWYLLIGPIGSGKTSLLTKSGLDFRLRDPSATDVSPGATRDCNWMFANEAVVMDTTGRYITQPDKSIDKAEWLALLDQLKKHRKAKPMDGLIIAVDISKIIPAREDEIEREAQNIRDRIDDIVEQLGISLPVYLVFTKCDMIQGFTEFFATLDKDARNQILGCSFNAKQQVNMATAFKDEWSVLYNSLKNHINIALTPDTDKRIRKGIYIFPKQLELATGKLNHFVSILSSPSTYLERPALQGFYLTSSTQENNVVDLMLADIQKNYSIQVSPTASQPTETKSMFVRDMLLKAIFPMRGDVTVTARAQRKSLFKWLIPLAIEVVVLGLIMMLIGFSFTKNKNIIQSSNTIARQIADIGNNPIPVNLVNDLQKQIDELKSFHLFPWRGQRIKVAKALEKRFFVEVPFYVVKDIGEKGKTADLANVVIYEEMQPEKQVKTDKSGETVLRAFKGNSLSQIRVRLSYQEAGFGVEKAKIETVGSGSSEQMLFEPLLVLDASRDYRKISVTYAKLRVLVAQVTDDKRAPVPGVPVSVSDPAYSNPLVSSFSDDTGAARLEFVSKDNVILNIVFDETGISYPDAKQLRIDPGKYDYNLEEMIRTKPPVFDLAVDSPQDGASTPDGSITVSGRVTALSKVISMNGIGVMVGGTPTFINNGTFSAEYALKDGKNEIGITVINNQTLQPLSQTIVRRVRKQVAGIPSTGGGTPQVASGGGDTAKPPEDNKNATTGGSQIITPPIIPDKKDDTPAPRPQVARIEVNPPTLRMKPGDQQKLTAVAYDSSNRPIPDADITWSVSGNIGQIDRTGNFVARQSGSSQITVASGNIKGSANVTIAEAKWRVIATQNKELKNMSFIDNNNGWAVGYPLLIAKTSDGGQSWQYQFDGASGKVTLSDGTTFGADKLKAALKAVCFINSGGQPRGWAVGEKGIIIHSPDGNKWVSQTSFIDDTLENVYFVDANKGWAIGRNGIILTTNNGGAKWTKQPYKDNTAFYGIYFLDQNRGWIVGQNATILSTTNGGTQWAIQVDPKQKSYLRDVFFVNPSKGWLVGTGGLIMNTTNGGQTWVVQTSKTINNLFGVRFLNENEGWIAGEGGLILRTTDGGKTWTENIVGNQNFFGMASAPTGGLWAIGAKGTIANYGF